MKPMAPPPEPVAPAAPVVRSLDPPVVAPRPARPPPTSLDPIAPEPSADRTRTAPAATFVPNWETSASRAAAAAAEAAAAAAALPPLKSEPVKAPKKLNATLQSIRGGQQRARRALLAAAAVLGVLFLGVLVFASLGADERAAGPPVDAATDARQRELTAKGNAERNALKAIVLYDQAVALAPRAPGARDALLGRARRYLDLGQLDAAIADVNLLRIRADADAVSDQIEALTARIKQKRP